MGRVLWAAAVLPLSSVLGNREMGGHFKVVLAQQD